MTLITYQEKKFLDKYELYDEYIYDNREEKILSVTYPEDGLLTDSQINEICNVFETCTIDRIVTPKGKEGKEGKSFKLKFTDPILADAVRKNPEGSELKVIDIPVDNQYFNLSCKKTNSFIDYGLISTVCFNEENFKYQTSWFCYDTNSSWYHVYNFNTNFTTEFDYWLIQPKFCFDEIIKDESLPDFEKLQILSVIVSF